MKNRIKRFHVLNIVPPPSPFIQPDWDEYYFVDVYDSKESEMYKPDAVNRVRISDFSDILTNPIHANIRSDLQFGEGSSISDMRKMIPYRPHIDPLREDLCYACYGIDSIFCVQTKQQDGLLSPLIVLANGSLKIYDTAGIKLVRQAMESWNFTARDDSDLSNYLEFARKRLRNCIPAVKPHVLCNGIPDSIGVHYKNSRGDLDEGGFAVAFNSKVDIYLDNGGVAPVKLTSMYAKDGYVPQLDMNGRCRPRITEYPCLNMPVGFQADGSPYTLHMLWLRMIYSCGYCDKGFSGYNSGDRSYTRIKL